MKVSDFVRNESAFTRFRYWLFKRLNELNRYICPEPMRTVLTVNWEMAKDRCNQPEWIEETADRIMKKIQEDGQAQREQSVSR